MADFSEILKGALSLDVKERAALVEKLLASLDDLSGPEADRLWGEEVHSRLDDYRSGAAQTTASEDVIRKAQKLFR